MTHPDIQDAASFLVQTEENDRPEKPTTLETRLNEKLYGWYLNCIPLEKPSGKLCATEVALPAALRNAHCESQRFEGGWKAETVSTWGRVVARKADTTRLLLSDEYIVPSRPGLRAEPGDALSVLACWDWIDETTGFWHLRRGVWPPKKANVLSRLFWNCSPINAPYVLKYISEFLASHSQVSYMIGTSKLAFHNGRSDALVLYMSNNDFQLLAKPLTRVAEKLALKLRNSTPRFTLKLEKGLACAESSIDGSSFSESRCALLVKAFKLASRKQRQDRNSLTQIIQQTFHSNGISLIKPYLQPRVK